MKDCRERVLACSARLETIKDRNRKECLGEREERLRVSEVADAHRKERDLAR